jgi:hypothetical protein
MDTQLQESLEALRSGDKEQQNAAFSHLLSATKEPVPWAYQIWEEVVTLLSHPNNRSRSIASQVLCSLAKSDPEERILGDLDALIAVTKDERFVTARHCMQSLWKVGVAGERQRQRLLSGLEARFRECMSEKNGTLIRFDVAESLRRIYDESGDEAVRAKARELIETEEDLKYRKKYARVWRTPGR